MLIKWFKLSQERGYSTENILFHSTWISSAFNFVIYRDQVNNNGFDVVAGFMSNPYDINPNKAAVFYGISFDSFHISRTTNSILL